MIIRHTPPSFSDVRRTPPRVFPAEGFSAQGVKPLFFENVPYCGRPTRVFAWMGVPRTVQDTSCPGIVLLHGGGGTAFDEWVRIWNARGYAAIAMDLCGCIPAQPVVLDGGPHKRHEHGGPPGWDASFRQADSEETEQWTYHAVAAAITAHSLLAAQPHVDPRRIAVTGISWGGYLASIVAGVDSRLQATVPIYGCGFLGHDSGWKDSVFPTLPGPLLQRWLDLWDPSNYLPEAHAPICWISGTNDSAYPLPSLRKSYELSTGPKTLCIRIEMPHGHPQGWDAPETAVFCDSLFRNGVPLPEITAYGRNEEKVWAKIASARPPEKIELCVTRALGHWTDRKWNAHPANYNPETGRVEASLPRHTTAWFFNVFDERNCVVSTSYEEVPGTITD
jgi:dienelactone hydrolase